MMNLSCRIARCTLYGSAFLGVTFGTAHAASFTCHDGFDSNNDAAAWVVSPLNTTRYSGTVAINYYGDGARWTTITINPPLEGNQAFDTNFAWWVDQLNTGCTHDPASGVFGTITTTFNIGAGIAHRLLIVQDGMPFVYKLTNGLTVFSASGTTTRTQSLRDFVFRRTDHSVDESVRLDLSCTGKALSFGFEIFKSENYVLQPRTSAIIHNAKIWNWDVSFETAAPGLVFSFPYNGAFQTKIPGNSLEGTASGTVQPISDLPAGHTGEALHLESDGKIKFPGSAANNFDTSDFSLDAWIRMPSHDKTNPLIDNRILLGPNATYGARGIRLSTYQGRIGLTMATGKTTNFISLVRIYDSKWHHVAVTVDRDSSTGGRIYVDGDIASPYVFDPTAHQGSLGTSNDLWIGYDPPNNFEGMPFDIDEIEFFNRALTAAEVQTLAQQPRCKAPA